MSKEIKLSEVFWGEVGIEAIDCKCQESFISGANWVLNNITPKVAIDFAIWSSEHFRRSYPRGYDIPLWFPDGYKPQFKKEHHTQEELWQEFIKQYKPE